MSRKLNSFKQIVFLS